MSGQQPWTAVKAKGASPLWWWTPVLQQGLFQITPSTRIHACGHHSMASIALKAVMRSRFHRSPKLSS